SSASQEVRNIPVVEISFAAPYRADETGRLIMNGRVCFFLSFTMFCIGRRHAQNIMATKKKTVPITIALPPIGRNASAAAPANVKRMIIRLCNRQSFKINCSITLVFMHSPLHDCVPRWQQKFPRVSCFPRRARGPLCSRMHSEDGTRRHWQLPQRADRFSESL